MNIKGAIFDFDGTLFDSMPLWKGLKFEFFDRMGLTLTDEDRKIFSGLFLMEAMPVAKERFNLKQSVGELYALFFELLKEKYLESALPKNDIIEFLEKLKQMNVKMGIATATGEAALIPLLEKFDMLQYFSVICSTYTVGAAKSDPKLFDYVCNQLGTKKQDTWIFDDALYAAKTAKNNGYNVVGIYDKSEPDAQGFKNTVDIYIKNYNEINL